MIGTVTSWKGEKDRFGFVTPDDPSWHDIMILARALPEHIRATERRVGLRVDFDVKYEKPEDHFNPQAVNVSVLSASEQNV
jgi:hypothetical protein